MTKPVNEAIAEAIKLLQQEAEVIKASACNAAGKWDDDPEAERSYHRYMLAAVNLDVVQAHAAELERTQCLLVERLEILARYVAYNGDDWVKRQALDAIALVKQPAPRSLRDMTDADFAEVLDIGVKP